jgi:hypothetical protein
MILTAVSIAHMCESSTDLLQPFVGFAFSLLKNGCASKTTRVSSAAFAHVAYLRHMNLSMKPNFVNAIFLALLPTGRGADACACMKHDDRLPGERNRSLHT